MSSHRPVGLIASGRMIESPLGRLPSLAREIGPVVASSLRLASRYANALRAGKPAALEDLSGCGLLVVQAPTDSASEWARLLLRRRLISRLRPCVFLGSDPGPAVLAELQQHHVPVAVALPAATHAGPALVAEGDPAALALMRGWARRAHVSLVALRRGHRPAFDAAVRLLGIVLPAVLNGAARGMRTAGLGPVEARRLLGRMAGDALRAQGLQGPGSRSRAAASQNPAGVDHEVGNLNAIDYPLASFYRHAMEASRLFQHLAAGSRQRADATRAAAGSAREQG
jgi:hypothetical protein